MPFKEPLSTDALLKQLHIHLITATGSPFALRQAEWFDFRNTEHPQTDDPFTLAVHAFFYICFDDHGSWRQNWGFMEGIFAFLMRHRLASPSKEQLEEFHRLISQYPASHTEMFRWFERVFPPLESD